MRGLVLGRRAIGQLGDGDGAPAGGANVVDGLAMGDGHQPGRHVTVRSQAGIRLHRRKERVGPGVLGVIGAQHGPADAQDRRAMLGDDVLEGWEVHTLRTSRRSRS